MAILLTIYRRRCLDHPGGTWTFGVERVGLLPPDRRLVYFTVSALEGDRAKPEMDCIDAPNKGDRYLARDYDGNVFFNHRVA